MPFYLAQCAISQKNICSTGKNLVILQRQKIISNKSCLTLLHYRNITRAVEVFMSSQTIHQSMIQNIKQKIKKIYHAFADRQLIRSLESADLALIKSLKSSRLTYLSNHKLAHLLTTSYNLDKNQIPGCLIEAGCALGGSAILLAKTKKSLRSMRVYDVFGMIPPPTEDDTHDVHDRYKEIVSGHSLGLGNDKYYGYEENLYQKVVNNFTSYGVIPQTGDVELMQGLVQDTLIVNDSVAMAHIDVDWYAPVMTCLERIYPKLSVGGVIILDDYNSWGGCKKAADDFLRRVKGTFEIDYPARTLTIKRIKKDF